MIRWQINGEGLLIIDGSGRIPDFPNREQDSDGIYWKDVSKDVRRIVIENGIPEIRARSFEYCINLTKVMLTLSLNWIRAYAFRKFRQ